MASFAPGEPTGPTRGTPRTPGSIYGPVGPSVRPRRPYRPQTSGLGTGLKSQENATAVAKYVTQRRTAGQAGY